MPEREIFAAQVVLAGAPDDARQATAERLGSMRPSAELVESVVRAFNAFGFRTGPVVGYSFSIEADAQLFREIFGVAIVYAADGGVRKKGGKAARLGSLPLERLPATLQAKLKTVVFSEPPAFGPGKVP